MKSHSYFHSILWVLRIGAVHCGRGLHGDMKTRRQELLGVSREAGHCSLCLAPNDSCPPPHAKYSYPFTKSPKFYPLIASVPRPESHHLNQVQGQMKFFRNRSCSVLFQLRFKCSSSWTSGLWVNGRSFLPPPLSDLCLWDRHRIIQSIVLFKIWRTETTASQQFWNPVRQMLAAPQLGLRPALSWERYSLALGSTLCGILPVPLKVTHVLQLRESQPAFCLLEFGSLKSSFHFVWFLSTQSNLVVFLLIVIKKKKKDFEGHLQKSCKWGSFRSTKALHLFKRSHFLMLNLLLLNLLRNNTLKSLRSSGVLGVPP